MGIPLPLAFPLAMDPQGSAAAAKDVLSNVDTLTEKVEATLANPAKAKRKVSAYSKKYKAEFKKLASKYKTKGGKWKTGGFKKAVKAAHKAVKK